LVSILSRFRRKKSPYAALTEEERIARYVYLLNTLPASVIESAHAAAFKDLPAERRREMFEQLRPFMSDAERDAASDDPTVLAKLVRRAEERRAARANGQGAADAGATVTATDGSHDGFADPRDYLRDSGVMALVAMSFVHSHAVNSYFLFGAGSLMLADEPAWIGEMVDPGTTGIDAAGYGGGWDAGGLGGFDGGVGGFDGGGGFG
jgi:hypothetical protein